MPETKPKKSKPKKPLQKLKGFRDILPEDQKYWDHVYARVAEIANHYQFGRMQLPVLEEQALFDRSIGEETDVVSKEMYRFEDPGERKVALRPEFTAGMVRSYIEHGMFNLPQPVKVFDVGACFRHDRPQAGRYRQFYQFDFEIFGEEDSFVDAYLIHIAYKLYQSFGLNVLVQVNSIGCKECRPGYHEVLIKALKSSKKELCEDCQGRLTKNPLRVLDCKEEGCQSVVAQKAPPILDNLCEPCKTHFMTTLELLDDFEVSYELTPSLVRGLDYYSRTTFEIVEAGVEGGAQSALGGGGRYDYLSEQLGGRETPAIGFAGGMDRVVEALKRNEVAVPDPLATQVFIAQLGNDARREAFKLFEDLVAAGISVSESFSKTGLKQQLELADKQKVDLTLIIGQKELVDKTVIIRDMENGIQEMVDIKKIVAEVMKRLEVKKASEESA